MIDGRKKRIVEVYSGIDVLVVDPPRSGLDDIMLKCTSKK